MAFTRRQFLKLAGGAGAGGAVLAACRPGPAELLVQSPLQIPEDLVTGVDNWYASRCGQCDSGCGVIVRVIEGRAKKVEGNPDHPLNVGKLCVRAHGAVQAAYHPDRIRRPMKAVNGRGSGKFQEISWDEAMDQLTGKLKPLAGRRGSVLLVTEPVTGSLRLITSRLATGLQATHAQFEPLEMSAVAAAVKRIFGTDVLPHFDMENAKSIVSFGADFLMGWVSQVRHSLGYGEFRQGAGHDKRGVFIHIDSRFSGTAANADEWVPVKPGAEGKLALAIAHVIVRDRLGDAQAASRLFGDNPAGALQAYAPDRVAAAAGVKAETIEHIAKEFAANQPGIALGGGSAGAHTNGVFNLSAIYALNQLVGNVGKKGGMILNPPAPLADDAVLRTEVPAGQYSTTSFKDWQGLSASVERGDVQALLVHNADLVYGLPPSVGLEQAIKSNRLPFVASFSSFLDDTTYYADLVLPSHLPTEDWGDTVPNPAPGHQVMTFQQPVIRPFGETRGFGDVLLALAQELGLEKELPWETHRDLLREEARKLQQLRRGNIQGATFEAYWNNLLARGVWSDPGTKATVQTAPSRLDLSNPDPVIAGGEGEYPFALVPFPSVSLADGRHAHLPWMQGTPDPLTSATWETWVEVNSQLAKEQGWKEGDLLTLTSPNGQIQAAVYPSPAVPRGVLAVPMGQGHRNYGRFANGRGANVLSIVAPSQERETGALAWAATRVKATPAGKRIRIPKFEGSVVPIDYDNHVKVTSGH